MSLKKVAKAIIVGCRQSGVQALKQDGGTIELARALNYEGGKRIKILEIRCGSNEGFEEALDSGTNSNSNSDGNVNPNSNPNSNPDVDVDVNVNSNQTQIQNTDTSTSICRCSNSNSSSNSNSNSNFNSNSNTNTNTITNTNIKTKTNTNTNMNMNMSKNSGQVESIQANHGQIVLKGSFPNYERKKNRFIRLNPSFIANAFDQRSKKIGGFDDFALNKHISVYQLTNFCLSRVRHIMINITSVRNKMASLSFCTKAFDDDETTTLQGDKKTSASDSDSNSSCEVEKSVVPLMNTANNESEGLVEFQVEQKILSDCSHVTNFVRKNIKEGETVLYVMLIENDDNFVDGRQGAQNLSIVGKENQDDNSLVILENTEEIVLVSTTFESDQEVHGNQCIPAEYSQPLIQAPRPIELENYNANVIVDFKEIRGQSSISQIGAGLPVLEISQIDSIENSSDSDGINSPSKSLEQRVHEFFVQRKVVSPMISSALHDEPDEMISSGETPLSLNEPQPLEEPQTSRYSNQNTSYWPIMSRLPTDSTLSPCSNDTSKSPTDQSPTLGNVTVSLDPVEDKLQYANCLDSPSVAENQDRESLGKKLEKHLREKSDSRTEDNGCTGFPLKSNFNESGFMKSPPLVQRINASTYSAGNDDGSNTIQKPSDSKWKYQKGNKDFDSEDGDYSGKRSRYIEKNHYSNLFEYFNGLRYTESSPALTPEMVREAAAAIAVARLGLLRKPLKRKDDLFMEPSAEESSLQAKLSKSIEDNVEGFADEPSFGAYTNADHDEDFERAVEKASAIVVQLCELTHLINAEVQHRREKKKDLTDFTIAKNEIQTDCFGKNASVLVNEAEDYLTAAERFINEAVNKFCSDVVHNKFLGRSARLEDSSLEDERDSEEFMEKRLASESISETISEPTSGPCPVDLDKYGKHEATAYDELREDIFHWKSENVESDKKLSSEKESQDQGPEETSIEQKPSNVFEKARKNDKSNTLLPNFATVQNSKEFYSALNTEFYGLEEVCEDIEQVDDSVDSKQMRGVFHTRINFNALDEEADEIEDRDGQSEESTIVKEKQTLGERLQKIRRDISSTRSDFAMRSDGLLQKTRHQEQGETISQVKDLKSLKDFFGRVGTARDENTEEQVLVSENKCTETRDSALPAAKFCGKSFCEYLDKRNFLNSEASADLRASDNVKLKDAILENIFRELEALTAKRTELLNVLQSKDSVDIDNILKKYIQVVETISPDIMDAIVGKKQLSRVLVDPEKTEKLDKIIELSEVVSDVAVYSAKLNQTSGQQADKEAYKTVPSAITAIASEDTNYPYSSDSSQNDRIQHRLISVPSMDESNNRCEHSAKLTDPMESETRKLVKISMDMPDASNKIPIREMTANEDDSTKRKSEFKARKCFTFPNISGQKSGPSEGFGSTTSKGNWEAAQFIIEEIGKKHKKPGSDIISHRSADAQSADNTKQILPSVAQNAKHLKNLKISGEGQSAQGSIAKAEKRRFNEAEENAPRTREAGANAQLQTSLERTEVSKSKPLGDQEVSKRWQRAESCVEESLESADSKASAPPESESIAGETIVLKELSDAKTMKQSVPTETSKTSPLESTKDVKAEATKGTIVLVDLKSEMAAPKSDEKADDSSTVSVKPLISVRKPGSDSGPKEPMKGSTPIGGGDSTSKTQNPSSACSSQVDSSKSSALTPAPTEGQTKSKFTDRRRPAINVISQDITNKILLLRSKWKQNEAEKEASPPMRGKEPQKKPIVSEHVNVAKLDSDVSPITDAEYQGKLVPFWSQNKSIDRSSNERGEKTRIYANSERTSEKAALQRRPKVPIEENSSSTEEKIEKLPPSGHSEKPSEKEGQQRKPKLSIERNPSTEKQQSYPAFTRDVNAVGAHMFAAIKAEQKQDTLATLNALQMNTKDQTGAVTCQSSVDSSKKSKDAISITSTSAGVHNVPSICVAGKENQPTKGLCNVYIDKPTIQIDSEMSAASYKVASAYVNVKYSEMESPSYKMPKTLVNFKAVNKPCPSSESDMKSLKQSEVKIVKFEETKRETPERGRNFKTINRERSISETQKLPEVQKRPTSQVQKIIPEQLRKAKPSLKHLLNKNETAVTIVKTPTDAANENEKAYMNIFSPEGAKDFITAGILKSFEDSATRATFLPYQSEVKPSSVSKENTPSEGYDKASVIVTSTAKPQNLQPLIVTDESRKPQAEMSKKQDRTPNVVLKTEDSTTRIPMQNHELQGSSLAESTPDKSSRNVLPPSIPTSTKEQTASTSPETKIQDSTSEKQTTTPVSGALNAVPVDVVQEQSKDAGPKQSVHTESQDQRAIIKTTVEPPSGKENIASLQAEEVQTSAAEKSSTVPAVDPKSNETSSPTEQKSSPHKSQTVKETIAVEKTATAVTSTKSTGVEKKQDESQAHKIRIPKSSKEKSFPDTENNESQSASSDASSSITQTSVPNMKSSGTPQATAVQSVAKVEVPRKDSKDKLVHDSKVEISNGSKANAKDSQGTSKETGQLKSKDKLPTTGSKLIVKASVEKAKSDVDCKIVTKKEQAVEDTAPTNRKEILSDTNLLNLVKNQIKAVKGKEEKSEAIAAAVGRSSDRDEKMNSRFEIGNFAMKKPLFSKLKPALSKFQETTKVKVQRESVPEFRPTSLTQSALSRLRHKDRKDADTSHKNVPKQQENISFNSNLFEKMKSIGQKVDGKSFGGMFEKIKSKAETVAAAASTNASTETVPKKQISAPLPMRPPKQIEEKKESAKPSKTEAVKHSENIKRPPAPPVTSKEQNEKQVKSSAVPKFKRLDENITDIGYHIQESIFNNPQILSEVQTSVQKSVAEAKPTQLQAVEKLGSAKTLEVKAEKAKEEKTKIEPKETTLVIENVHPSEVAVQSNKEQKEPKDPEKSQASNEEVCDDTLHLQQNIENLKLLPLYEKSKEGTLEPAKLKEMPAKASSPTKAKHKEKAEMETEAVVQREPVTQNPDVQDLKEESQQTFNELRKLTKKARAALEADKNKEVGPRNEESLCKKTDESEKEASDSEDTSNEASTKSLSKSYHVLKYLLDQKISHGSKIPGNGAYATPTHRTASFPIINERLSRQSNQIKQKTMKALATASKKASKKVEMGPSSSDKAASNVDRIHSSPTPAVIKKPMTRDSACVKYKKDTVNVSKLRSGHIVKNSPTVIRPHFEALSQRFQTSNSGPEDAITQNYMKSQSQTNLIDKLTRHLRPQKKKLNLNELLKHTPASPQNPEAYQSSSSTSIPLKSSTSSYTSVKTNVKPDLGTSPSVTSNASPTDTSSNNVNRRRKEMQMKIEHNRNVVKSFAGKQSYKPEKKKVNLSLLLKQSIATGSSEDDDEEETPSRYTGTNNLKFKRRK